MKNCLLLLFAFIISQCAFATSKTWTGSVSSNWSNSSNWSPSYIPNLGDSVYIHSATNTPVLTDNSYCNTLILTSGAVLDLGGNNFSQSGNLIMNDATIKNGILQLNGLINYPTITLVNSEFDVIISGTIGTLTASNSVFKKSNTFNIRSNSPSYCGGNTFEKPTHISNNGSGELFFGFNAPDTFQDSVFIDAQDLITSSTGDIHMAYNSSSNEFNGFCQFELNSQSSIYFCEGADTASVDFFAQVLIGVAVNSQAIEFSRNAHFHSGAPLELSNLGWISGELRLMGVTMDDSLSIVMDENEKGNSILIDNGSVFSSIVNCTAQSIYLGEATFNDSTTFVKTGDETNQPHYGHIIANAPFSLSNTGTGSFITSYSDSCSFRSDLTLINTDEGSIDIASNGLLKIGGDLKISTSAGRVALGEYSTDTNSVQGNIDLNCNGGLVVLGMIKQSSGTINTTSFANSELDLLGFRSTNSDSLIFTGSDNSRLVLNQCQIQGPFNVELPSIVTNGGIYNGNTLFHKTGSDYDQGGGSMVFHGKAHFKTSSDGYFLLNYDASNNQFWDDLIIECIGDGKVMTASDGSSDLYKNLEFRGSTTPDLIQGSAMNFVGSENQHILSTGSISDFSMATLLVEKPFGELIIEVPLHIQNELNLSKGIIQLSDSNSLFLDSLTIVSFGSDSSYVEGAISRTGTSEFTFPTGGNGQYAPISIEAVSSSTTFKASYIGNDPNSLYSRSSKDSTLGFVNRCGYWKLERIAGTGTTKATLGWSNNPCFSSNPVDAKIALWDGSHWKDKGNGAYSGNSTAGNAQMSNSFASYPAIIDVTGVCGLTAGLSANRDTLYSGYLATITATPTNQSNYKFYVNNVLKQDSSISQFKTHTLVNGDSVKLLVANMDGCESYHTKSIYLITPPLLLNPNLFSNDSIQVFAKDSILSDTSIHVYISGNTLSKFKSQTCYQSHGLFDNDLVNISNKYDSLNLIQSRINIDKGIPIEGSDTTNNFTTGLYWVENSGDLPNIINLIGDSNSVFIFNIQGNLNLDSSIKINFIGSIDERNVIFNVNDTLFLKDPINATYIASRIYSNYNFSNELDCILISKTSISFKSNQKIGIRADLNCIFIGCNSIINPNFYTDTSNSPFVDFGHIFDNKIAFERNRLCGWDDFTGTPAVYSEVPNANPINWSAIVWSSGYQGGGSEGIISKPGGLNVNPEKVYEIEFDYRLAINTEIDNATQFLDQLFLIFVESGISVPNNLLLNIDSKSYPELPFSSIPSAGYIFMNDQELKNITNTTWKHFYGTINTTGYNQINRMIIAPRTNLGTNNIPYILIDNLKVNACCSGSSMSINSESTINQIPLNSTNTSTFFTEASGSTTAIIESDFATYPSHIISINGDLIVDQNLNITNANIKMLVNSKIVVQPGKTLRILDSQISSCIRMWDGIDILPGGILIMDNSIILDADTAVSSWGGANFNLSNSTFENNDVGIKYCSYLYTFHPGYLRGCTIKGNNLLKSPLETRWSSVGVLIERCKGVQVGITGISQIHNTFDRLVIGIDIAQSNVTIYNNHFSNIANSSINSSQPFAQFFAIRSNAIGGNYTLRIGSPTVSSNESNDFTRCTIGIASFNGNNFYAYNNTFDQIETRAISLISNSTRIIEVKNNYFSKYNTGIYLFGNVNSTVSINDNNMHILNQWPQAKGIDVTGNISPAIMRLNISGNDISWVNQGIVVRNVISGNINPYTIGYCFIHDNLIRTTTLSNSSTRGIWVSSCTRSNVFNNTITSSSANNVNANGIRSENSTGSAFWCNDITANGHAMYFTGVSPVSVQGNKFTSNYSGITIDHAVIGPQYGIFNGSTLNNKKASMNSWLGTHTRHFSSLSSTGSLSPFVLANVTNHPEYNPAGYSSFVNYSNPQTSTNAINTSNILSVSSSSGNIASLVSNLESCVMIDLEYTGGGGGGGGTHDIVQNARSLYQISNEIDSIDIYHVESRWQADLAFYNLAKNDSVTLVDSTLNNFFFHLDSMSTGTLNKIRENFPIYTMSDTNATAEQLIDSLNTFGSDLSTVSSQLRTFVSSNDVQTAQVAVLDAQNSISSFNRIKIKQILILQSDTIDDSLQNIQLDSLKNLSTETPNSLLDELYSLAQECPYEKGSAVWWARASFPDTVFTNSCEIITDSIGARIGNYNIKVEKHTVIENPSVYPNPAINEFFVVLPSDITNAVFELYDIAGQLVYSTLLCQTTQQIKTRSIASGLYLYTIKDLNHNLLGHDRIILNNEK